MNGKSHSAIPPLVAMGVVLLASTTLLMSLLKAESKEVSTTYSGILFRCLQEKWPDIQSSGGGRHVFVPEIGQNLAWDKDKQAWIDVKTGKCICPECPPSRTAQQPTPTPAGDTLKRVLQSVNIGIGIGGGHTFGHDEHERGRRTSESHRTDTHKTLPTGCKCHPCTYSPCHCH